MKPSDSDSPRSDAKSPSEPPINTIADALYVQQLVQDAKQHHVVTIEGENKKAFRDIEIALKTGFYAGQAMARVELEDCHTNWKKWNSNEELQNEQ